MALVLPVVAVSALAAQARKAAGPPTMGEISQEQLPVVARRVKAIAAEPATLTLRVGETVSLAKVTVTVIDSAGKRLGRLPFFDFAVPPNGPAAAVPRQVTGVRPGTPCSRSAIRAPRGRSARIRVPGRR